MKTLPNHVQPDIKSLNKNELTQWCAEKDIKVYRAAQIMRWIYVKQADAFDEMTDISLKTRQLLSDTFSFSSPEIKKTATSADGSRKFLFELEDANCIETVLIPEKDHYTLCISTQVGCAMGCRFCMTATSGLIRNLAQAEIVNQVIGVSKTVTGDKPLRNIVLMGMGEPLANYKNVIRALRIITDSDAGLQFSTRRVTLSTCGVISRFIDLGRDTRINLAISLNATDNRTRSLLMPINDKYPIEQLIQACVDYPLAPRNKITFEYILIKDVNDSMENARQLAKLLRPVKAKINLIPFNEHPASDFRRPAESVVLKFQSLLHDKGYTAVIRHSKGQDIAAACGQLSAQQKQSADPMVDLEKT